MKKICAFVLILTISCALFACGENKENSDETKHSASMAPETSLPTSTATPELPTSTATPELPTSTATVSPGTQMPTIQPSVSPEQELIYNGVMGKDSAKIMLSEGKCSVSIIKTVAATEEEMAEMGLTGTLFMNEIQRIEIPGYSVSNGVATISGNEYAIYMSFQYTGSAAETILNRAKDAVEQQYATGKINKETYDAQMALINGGEQLQGETSGKITFVATLDNSTKSCQIISFKAEDAENNTDLWEYEYNNKIVTKEVHYCMYQPNPFDGPYAEVITYYPDGITVKTEAEYEIYEENGKYEIHDFNLNRLTEYRVDGTIKLETWYDNYGGVATIYSQIEYDEQGNSSKEKIYDSHGNLEHYYLYSHTETSFTSEKYKNEKLTEVKVYEDHEDGERYLTKSIEYFADGGRSEKEYYPGSYNIGDRIKKNTIYNAAGTVTNVYEYNEDGMEIGA